MKAGAGFLIRCATGALVVATAPCSGALAADLSMEPAPPVVTWWWHGNLDVGARTFVNDPQRDGLASAGGKSLAKYYEYGTNAPGPFANGNTSFGTTDGVYRADIWAKHVGYSDQSYLADLSKAGEQYLSFGWDQTPHVYSTSAETLYNGIGTNTLTLPAGLSNKLATDAGCVAGTPPTGCVNGLSGNAATGAAKAAAINSDIQSNLKQTDIGIQRDTAAVEYRATPTPDWDFRVAYSNMHREGTQVDGVLFSPDTTGVRVDVAKPVNDTTHNYSASGEYYGLSPWGQKFNFSMGFSGSAYVNSFSSYTVENPFCLTGAGTDGCARGGAGQSPIGAASSPLALMSLDPDNQAYGGTATLGADLPFKSRYMGTVAYTTMRQNAAFIPFSSSAALNSAMTFPASSLNGEIDTVLVNNVVTTHITPDLKAKLSYRYYDYNNTTPMLLFPNWVFTDTATATAHGGGFAPTESIGVSYTKQDAGAEATWRPTREWNLGAAYNYERYDWTHADVDVTNENSGKVFADWKPLSSLTLRGSWEYAVRRYENLQVYPDDTAVFAMEALQWPCNLPGTGIGGATTCGNTSTFIGLYSTQYRQFLLDDRNREAGKFYAAYDILPGLTITPNAGLANSDYPGELPNQFGLLYDHGYNAGADLALVINPNMTLMVGYTYEHHNQLIRSSSVVEANAQGSLTTTCGGTNCYEADVVDNINTVMAAVQFQLIPSRLSLKLSYTYSYSTDTQPVIFDNGTGPSASTGGQYPPVTTNWQRVDATARYKFDEDFVRQLGWTGDAFLMLSYAWERNSVNNWQIDDVVAYAFSGYCGGTGGGTPTCGYQTWMASDNPNYQVHIVSAALAFKW